MRTKIRWNLEWCDDLNYGLESFGGTDKTQGTKLPGEQGENGSVATEWKLAKIHESLPSKALSPPNAVI